MQQEQNLYDAVERAGAWRQMPRLDLWQLVVDAISKRELHIRYPSDPSERPALTGPTWQEWMAGFQAAVNRYNDPRVCTQLIH